MENSYMTLTQNEHQNKLTLTEFTIADLTNENEVLELIRWHNANSKYVVIDIETTGLNPFIDSITDIIISGKEQHGSFILPSTCAPLLSKLEIPVVAHNFKFDFNFLYRIGIDLRRSGLLADTMLLDHLLDENAEHSLDAIVQRRYNSNYKEVFWSTYKTFTEAPRQAQIEYAGRDVIYTGMVYRDIVKDLQVPDSLIEHVHKLALTLYETELLGVRVDVDYLQTMGNKLKEQIKSSLVSMRQQVDLPCSIIENDMYLVELSKRKTQKGKVGVKRPEFNFDSTIQLSTLLYNKLNLPVQLNRKRKSTVDDAALGKLEHRHPIIPLVREYRGFQKVYTSFIEGTLEKMVKGRIHPSFNVNGTVTGRISSSSPNMQQLPKDGGVRGIYVPNEGYSLLSCDYGQLEVAIAAHFSQDENLLKIINEGVSQHDITAKGLSIDRGTAKTINFAMQYGAGVIKIQAILGCNKQDAEVALNKYWETYKGLHKLIKWCHNHVDEGKPIINPFGRRRHFPTKFDDHWAKESAYRQSASSLIQGTGADITSRALYLVANDLKALGIGRALFSVHDELVIEVEKSVCESYRSKLVSIMQGVGKDINLTIPLKAECSPPMERWMKG